jgi:N-acetylated-alpha-linked acidic dipeptidase
MKRVLAVSVIFVFALMVPAGADEESLPGYTHASSPVERDWEAKFRAIPVASNERDYVQRLSARPHHVGSPYDKDNAEWILSQFKSWGWDAHIENFDVLFPSPKERKLELFEPTKFTAKLMEPPVAVDPTSGQNSEQLPTYNAYSADGDVTGPLVYVNYGVPDDYDQLDRLGISVKGAIVIARYGGSWRGVKPKVAAEHGAIGCLIYSDPHDDGYFEGDVFPKGPMRPPDGVQRGSVMDFASYSPGDPLTPGIGATKDAKRLTLKDDIAITKIPTLPISYGDAQPLLAALAGPMAPAGWRGSLPIPYHLGSGPAKVHLLVKANWDMKTLYDVIAKLPGSDQADQWVIRGNHHDGWVNGAEDPISGQAALLEEARSLGELWKQGWRPKRTIIYCAWDGEEEGLLGSTEWGETHDAELKQHAVIYINSDSNGRGYLFMGGSPSLTHFINGVARDIQDPETHLSAFERTRFGDLSRARSEEDRKDLREHGDLRLGPLGSGSDYTVFEDHLGIASLNLGFGGEDQGGIYHSVYDDFYWYTHFSDTDFSYGRTLSEMIGSSVMRFADADLLPFEFKDLSSTIRLYSKQLKTAAESQRDGIIQTNKDLADGYYTAISDPKHPMSPPPHEEVPPHLNFAPLDNATDALAESADRYHSALAKAWGAGVDATTLADLNKKLAEAEHHLTTDEGLLRRGWYKQMIDAPGVYSGYGAKTIPGVREAVEQKHWDEASAEIVRISKVLDAESSLINSAAAELEAVKPK